MITRQSPSIHELRKDLYKFQELIALYHRWQDQEAAQPLIQAYEQRIREIRVQALLLGLSL
ncbi:hypothetical protein HVE01_30980 [Vreelandella venusta]|nr:hypothetical protein HVE01_30980 [Halomonas venusta]